MVETRQGTDKELFNQDIDLLLLSMLLEACHKGQSIFVLNDFLKGDYQEIPAVKAELTDTNDYTAIPRFVFDHIGYLLENTKIGRTTSIGLQNVHGALVDLLVIIAADGAELMKDGGGEYFSDRVREVCRLMDLRDKEDVYSTSDKSTAEELKTAYLLRDFGFRFEEKSEGLSRIGDLVDLIPAKIELEIAFDNEKVAILEQQIAHYIHDFIKDNFVDNKPSYLENRYYFAQQIESFFHYLDRLQPVNNAVNLPFSILTETDFEAVKILNYLQLNGLISMSWFDTGSWRVKFTSVPITLPSLLRGEMLKSNTSKQEKQGESISHLILVKAAAGSKHQLIVNKDYQNPIGIDVIKDAWQMFFKVANGERIAYQPQAHNGLLDYLNTNKKNKLYTATACKLTKVLGVESDRMIITVPFEILTKKGYQQRLNKLETA